MKPLFRSLTLLWLVVLSLQQDAANGQFLRDFLCRLPLLRRVCRNRLEMTSNPTSSPSELPSTQPSSFPIMIATPCDPDPCVNGECIADGGPLFTCACDPAWTGETCELQALTYFEAQDDRLLRFVDGNIQTTYYGTRKDAEANILGLTAMVIGEVPDGPFTTIHLDDQLSLPTQIQGKDGSQMRFDFGQHPYVKIEIESMEGQKASFRVELFDQLEGGLLNSTTLNVSAIEGDTSNRLLLVHGSDLQSEDVARVPRKHSLENDRISNRELWSSSNPLFVTVQTCGGAPLDSAKIEVTSVLTNARGVTRTEFSSGRLIFPGTGTYEVSSSNIGINPDTLTRQCNSVSRKASKSCGAMQTLNRASVCSPGMPGNSLIESCESLLQAASVACEIADSSPSRGQACNGVDNRYYGPSTFIPVSVTHRIEVDVLGDDDYLREITLPGFAASANILVVTNPPPDEERCASGACVPSGSCECEESRSCNDGTCVNAETECCHDERVCNDPETGFTCAPPDSCCPYEKPCLDDCILVSAVCLGLEPCPSEGRKRCRDGACVWEDSCDCFDERECSYGVCVDLDCSAEDGSCRDAGGCCPGERACFEPNGLVCRLPNACCSGEQRCGEECIPISEECGIGPPGGCIEPFYISFASFSCENIFNCPDLGSDIAVFPPWIGLTWSGSAPVVRISGEAVPEAYMVVEGPGAITLSLPGSTMTFISLYLRAAGCDGPGSLLTLEGFRDGSSVGEIEFTVEESWAVLELPQSDFSDLTALTLGATACAEPEEEDEEIFVAQVEVASFDFCTKEVQEALPTVAPSLFPSSPPSLSSSEPTPADPQPCDLNPCLNGECIIGDGSSYSCVCEQAWTGKNCDLRAVTGFHPEDDRIMSVLSPEGDTEAIFFGPKDEDGNATGLESISIGPVRNDGTENFSSILLDEQQRPTDIFTEDGGFMKFIWDFYPVLEVGMSFEDRTLVTTIVIPEEEVGLTGERRLYHDEGLAALHDASQYQPAFPVGFGRELNGHRGLAAQRTNVRTRPSSILRRLSSFRELQFRRDRFTVTIETCGYTPVENAALDVVTTLTDAAGNTRIGAAKGRHKFSGRYEVNSIVRTQVEIDWKKICDSFADVVGEFCKIIDLLTTNIGPLSIANSICAGIVAAGVATGIGAPVAVAAGAKCKLIFTIAERVCKIITAAAPPGTNNINQFICDNIDELPPFTPTSIFHTAVAVVPQDKTYRVIAAEPLDSEFTGFSVITGPSPQEKRCNDGMCIPKDECKCSDEEVCLDNTCVLNTYRQCFDDRKCVEPGKCCASQRKCRDPLLSEGYYCAAQCCLNEILCNGQCVIKGPSGECPSVCEEEEEVLITFDDIPEVNYDIEFEYGGYLPIDPFLGQLEGNPPIPFYLGLEWWGRSRVVLNNINRPFSAPAHSYIFPTGGLELKKPEDNGIVFSFVSAYFRGSPLCYFPGTQVRIVGVANYSSTQIVGDYSVTLPGDDWTLVEMPQPNFTDITNVFIYPHDCAPTPPNATTPSNEFRWVGLRVDDMKVCLSQQSEAPSERPSPAPSPTADPQPHSGQPVSRPPTLGQPQDPTSAPSGMPSRMPSRMPSDTPTYMPTAETDSRE